MSPCASAGRKQRVGKRDTEKTMTKAALVEPLPRALGAARTAAEGIPLTRCAYQDPRNALREG